MAKNQKVISILRHMSNLLTTRAFEEDALEAAIQALNEVEEYRAIGTPEELRSLKERAFDGMELAQIAAALMRLKEYERIGTPEECLRNKDFLDFLADKMNPNDFETYLRLYNALEEKGCEQ